jgi:Tfp pilus assembly protein PilF
LSLAMRTALEERLQGEAPVRHAAAHLTRGKAFLAAGRPQAAERELAEAVSLLPQDGEAHVALAEAYEAQGRHREAAAELEMSLKLQNTVTAHLMLARVYLSLDQMQAAREHGQAALSLDPSNREAQALMSEIPEKASAERKSP